ncbi:hypothetical protein ACWEFL_01465 [Streptomyces sp. NPDC004838]
MPESTAPEYPDFEALFDGEVPTNVNPTPGRLSSTLVQLFASGAIRRS